MTDDAVKSAEAMLLLLRAEPTLLPAVPVEVVDVGRAIERRRRDEVHSCLSCGARARRAYVVESSIGPRWLDLCPDCDYAVRKANGG